MSEDRTDDLYNKLRNDVGTDFRKINDVRIRELYSFRCQKCGYHNVHNIKELECGCGNKLQGTLVYRKIGDQVIYDMRGLKKKKR
jgi:predicted nucleic-acid-binding Zn-ribbon protein